MNNLYGKYPGTVASYDKVTRTCRVEIPGVTNGGDILPLAEILYPVGDKWRAETGIHPTEIEMLPGDTVWLEFIGQDDRYPLIVGYRNPQSGNAVDWRRIHHANIELIAEGVMHLVVGNSSITMAPGTMTLAVGSSNIVMTNGGIHINGTRVDLN